jgi:hypothetical protein
MIRRNTTSQPSCSPILPAAAVALIASSRSSSALSRNWALRSAAAMRIRRSLNWSRTARPNRSPNACCSFVTCPRGAARMSTMAMVGRCCWS